MKKGLVFVVLCLMALTIHAQRCAVLEFKAGVGISQADVDGISAIFITYFRPEGYTMVERTQIDKAIDEQGFQRGKMTEDQMVRIGEILNVSKIVVGDVNVVMGQYNVDVRAINVESGTIAATEGATFNSSAYRASMQSIAQKLAGKIGISSGQTVPPQPKQPSEPYVIYGYLKVFPNDLGTFSEQPKQVIARINQSQQYGYGTWRLPTNEELALMQANNVLGASGSYMTKENEKGIVRLVTDKEKGETISIPDGYVDLGLKSGTLWKSQNESNYYAYYPALSKFGKQIPSKKQWDELRTSCTWTWKGNGYSIVGPNDNTIFLPTTGGRRSDGTIWDYQSGYTTYYWSSTIHENYDDYAWCLAFKGNNYIIFDDEDISYGYSIRLVLTEY